MNNNDIFRRLRFCFNFNEKNIIRIITLADSTACETSITAWLSKPDEQSFVEMPDEMLSAFLNGLIIFKRGKKDDKKIVNEAPLTNNLILQKLKIALKLNSDDILQMLADIGFKLSKHELSAIFRNPEHKHYRICKTQLLRKFLSALQNKLTNTPTSSKRSNNAGANKTQTEQSSSEKKSQNKKIIVNSKIEKKSNKDKSRKTLTLSPDKIWKDI